MTPVLSIVIPHLNEPQALLRCLAALEAQRRKDLDFEIIVADNGSAQPLPDLEAIAPGTRLVVEFTPGPGPARNRGAAAARGELLAFIDADCVAMPGWARTIVDFFNAHPETDFVGGAIGILPAGHRLSGVEAYEAVFSYRTAMLVRRQHFAPTGNMAVRTEGFRKVGPFAGIARHEDRVWGHEAIRRGLKLDYLPEARVLTAGCADFASLARRTDIHVAHDFSEVGSNWRVRTRWALLALTIAASPPLQLAAILRSPEVPGAADKARAFGCLIRIRLYRARRMLQLLFHDWSGGQLKGWNRTDTTDGPAER